MNPAMPPLPIWLWILIGIPLVIGSWCLLIALISLVGGWHALAKSYRKEETTFRIADSSDGERFRWASLSMGPPLFPTNYGNCVTVFVGERGIGVRVMPLFRVLHPPLLIPWNAIEKCELDRIFLVYWRARAYLSDRRYPICFYGQAGKDIYNVWFTRGTMPATDK